MNVRDSSEGNQKSRRNNEVTEENPEQIGEGGQGIQVYSAEYGWKGNQQNGAVYRSHQSAKRGVGESNPFVFNR